MTVEYEGEEEREQRATAEDDFDDDLLEEQEHKGYGEDEGERDDAFDDDEQ